MREHQITITLQAEQFQEIQRLARSAGARSVGTFAREKLLSAVGLNLGSKNLKATRAQDLTSVTGELKRLHRELQIFIAESLSAKDYGYVVNGPQTANPPGDTTSGTSSNDQNLSAPPFEEDSAAALQDYGQSAKAAEELAERAFIISPRLGAIEEIADEPMDFSDPLDELLGEYDEATAPIAASSMLNAMENVPATSNVIQDVIQKDEGEAINGAEGEFPHSVFDAELAAFQNQQKQSSEATNEETPKEPAAPVVGSATAATEEDSAKPTDEQKSDEEVHLAAQSGIQEEDSDGDFQNRPPLSGGPPPRKRRT
jgi:hypothetical protein